MTRLDAGERMCGMSERADIPALTALPNLPSDTRWNGTTPTGWATFTIGQDETTVPVTINLAGTNALITGAAGTGKTQCGHVIAAQAAVKGWDILVCDPSSDWEHWLRRYPPAHGASGEGVDAAREWLRGAARELARRHAALREHDVTSWTQLRRRERRDFGINPMLVVVNDRLAITESGPGFDADAESASTQSVQHLRDLLRDGPRVGMHLLITDSSPSRLHEQFGEVVESNIGVRIATGDSGMTVRKIAFPKVGFTTWLDLYDSEARKVRGRALVQDGLMSPPQPTQLMWLGPNLADLWLHNPSRRMEDGLVGLLFRNQPLTSCS